MSRADNYTAYLASDHWKSLRLRAIVAHGNQCANCQKTPVQVHHLRYGTWFDVTTDDLIPLCAHCHELAHSNREANQLIYSLRPSTEKRDLLIAILRRDSHPVVAPNITARVAKPNKQRNRKQLRRAVESVLGIHKKHSSSLSREKMQRIIETNGAWVPGFLEGIIARKY